MKVFHGAEKIVLVLETGKLGGLFPADALASLGYEKTRVEGIFEAIDRLERGAHALVLCTPRLSASDIVFLAELHATAPETALLVAAAAWSDGDAASARAVGSTALLEWPIELEALRVALAARAAPGVSLLIRRH